MKPSVDLKRITDAYRILGLSMDGSLQDCRYARNKLIQKFHPDKYPKGWHHDDTSLEDRIRLVQEAYRYIVDNYSEISGLLKPIVSQKLSNQLPKGVKSHWAYQQIQTFKKED